MAVGICLPPKVVDSFKQALIKGKLDPEKLAAMTSEARHKALADVVGEGNAKFVNSQFESKILLKNQQLGYVRWAEKLTGIAPATRRDLITRIGKMDKILNPTEEKAFLKDLASTKLGIDVTTQEAKKIALMSSKLQELEAKRHSGGTFPSEQARMAYGYAKADLGQYLAELKNAAEKPTFKESLMHPVETSSKLAGFSKAVKAAFDDSALLRQNWKTLLTHPGIWMKNAVKNVGDLKRQGIQGIDVMREVKADLYSRPNADIYQKMKINIGKTEEEFGDPTILEKTPGINRLYKTSEVAYTAVLYRSRADLADLYYRMAEKSGVNVADTKELEAIGKLINATTGRGDLGRFEGQAANTLNNVFFSARFVKSNFDTLTAHQLQRGVTPFVRKQAAKELVKIVTVTAGIMALSNQLMPGSVEFDPRSKNFGKIKVGHTTFDITGGMGALVTLAAQLVTQSTKSTNSGIVSKLNSGYGSQKGSDVIKNFIQGKLSPAAAVVNDLLINHADFQGNKPTIKGELGNLLIPLPVTTYTQAKQDAHGANALLVELADAFGLSANTNVPNKNLKQSLTKGDQAFLTKVGDKKFQEYNQKYNDKLNAFEASDFYKNLPDDKKSGAITTAEGQIKKDLYKSYGFTPPKTKTDKSFNKSILNAVR